MGCASAESEPARGLRRRHPALTLEMPQEIRRGRHAAENGAHMPFADKARWQCALVAGSEKNPKAGFRFEDAKAVVAHRQMARVRKPRRCFQEPAVQRQQLLRCRAETLRACRGEFLQRGQRGWRERSRQVHVAEPIGGGRQNAEVFREMLQAERLDGNVRAAGDGDRLAEDARGFGDTLAVMPQRAVREMPKHSLGSIDYMDSI